MNDPGEDGRRTGFVTFDTPEEGLVRAAQEQIMRESTSHVHHFVIRLLLQQRCVKDYNNHELDGVKLSAFIGTKNSSSGRRK